ncbi:MAG TPA: hypothetical protein DCO79_17200 [Spirochaeta sp.]|nr:hypothetical protein [Spirochaeta sp.]
MKHFVKIIRYLILISFAVLLSSCGYGFLNLDGERGMIEIEFEITGAGFADVDRIEFELTPPKGMTTSVRLKLENNSTRYEFDNADIGTWTLKTILYSGFKEVQTLFLDGDPDRSILVSTDMKTSLSIDAAWDSTGYVPQYQEWSTEINDAGSVQLTPAFGLTEMRIKPGVVESYHSKERYYLVNTSILGSDFNNNIGLLRLIYPNGTIYEFGSEASSRSVAASHFIENDRIEIQWAPGYEADVLNGGYDLRMLDSAGVGETMNIDFNLDYDLYMPDIPDGSIPESLPRSVAHTFNYDFTVESAAGTLLVYLINKNDPSEIYDYDHPNLPPDAFAVSGTTGTLDTQIDQLTDGATYQFMLVAVQHHTTNPVGDAVAAGVDSPDLRASRMVDTINDIYGADTGYVICKMIEFSVTP